MRFFRFFLLAFVVASLASCSLFERHQHDDSAVELSGHYLSYRTLDSLTSGLSAEDSASVAEHYVRRWAKDILLYDRALEPVDKSLEAMVEDYRRSLYVHAYEQRLVAHRMSKEVDDSTVQAVYTRFPERFTLRESIAEGLLLVVPTAAPHIDKTRQTLLKHEEGYLEYIEKYAYQYATAYELFDDHWLTAQQLMLYLPLERDELTTLLARHSLIELQDTLSTFLLLVTDKHLAGEPMPIDYARPAIEELVLRQRQVDFLKGEYDRLYDDALRHHKIVFYEKNRR